MKNQMKHELFNDILTGLLVAATFAAVIPTDALAQLTTTAGNVGQNVVNPAIKIAGYISYGIGTVMTIAGIAGAKKHADNPSSNPLGPALGKLGAGAAFLAAPTVVGMVAQTGQTTVTGTANYTTIPGVN